LRVFSDLTCITKKCLSLFVSSFLRSTCNQSNLAGCGGGKRDQARVALTVAHQTPRRLVVHGPARRYSAWWCGCGVLLGVVERKQHECAAGSRQCTHTHTHARERREGRRASPATVRAIEAGSGAPGIRSKR
jgi:hypothetical protein